MGPGLPSVGCLPGSMFWRALTGYHTGRQRPCLPFPICLKLPPMKPVPDLTLYGTTACHLCEAATHELAPLAGNGLHPREQDITESDALMERYQLRIPVLRREDTGAELDWPFDLATAMLFLADVLGEES